MDRSGNYRSEFSNSEVKNHYQNIDDLSTDGVLRYIDNLLMEDQSMDGNTSQLLESSDFQAKERSFYEVLGQEYQQQEPSHLVTDRFSNKRDYGVDEANEFLPSNSIRVQVQDPNGGDHSYKQAVTRGKNNHHTDHEFDTWTCVDAGTSEKFASYLTDLRNASSKKKNQSDDTKETFDFRSLLLSCAQAVVSGNHNGTNNILREILFHYSALFDMIEAIISKERPERALMESILGNQAMNVIACEGLERLERPETCNQWRQRHLRAGLKQVRFERKLLSSIVKKVRNFYHREFVVVEDNKWLKMSWKGRTICALSCWQPAEASA